MPDPAASAWLAVVHAVAEAHDKQCASELRHTARELTRLGPCRPEQDCPVCTSAPGDTERSHGHA